MIIVAVTPNQIPLHQSVDLKLRLTNIGIGTCTSVRYTFQMPKEILLLRGGRQLKLNLLEKGLSYEHLLRVRGEKQGDYLMISTNFSFCDPSGRIHRVQENNIALRVVPQLFIPAPDLRLVINTEKLELGQWSSLSGVVKNIGEGLARSVSLSLSGPAIRVQQVIITELLPGETKPFVIPIHASEAGSSVPIDVKGSFKDENLQEYERIWHHYLIVETKSSPITSGDIYLSYHAGLSKLLSQLDKSHYRYTEALTYQNRLVENLNRSRHYGDTEARRAERAEIIGYLNELAISTIGVSFSVLIDGPSK